mmetsp:Transcript_25755/g.75476  ORF Transcript_25755/g.75476 Transcript_25755/m.75476 type:complete len:324 (-) Transcript_25755:204-1175(-)
MSTRCCGRRHCLRPPPARAGPPRSAHRLHARAAGALRQLRNRHARELQGAAAELVEARAPRDGLQRARRKARHGQARAHAARLDHREGHELVQGVREGHPDTLDGDGALGQGLQGLEVDAQGLEGRDARRRVRPSRVVVVVARVRARIPRAHLGARHRRLRRRLRVPQGAKSRVGQRLLCAHLSREHGQSGLTQARTEALVQALAHRRVVTYPADFLDDVPGHALEHPRSAQFVKGVEVSPLARHFPRGQGARVGPRGVHVVPHVAAHGCQDRLRRPRLHVREVLSEGGDHERHPNGEHVPRPRGGGVPFLLVPGGREVLRGE